MWTHRRSTSSLCAYTTPFYPPAGAITSESRADRSWILQVRLLQSGSPPLYGRSSPMKHVAAWLKDCDWAVCCCRPAALRSGLHLLNIDSRCQRPTVTPLSCRAGDCRPQSVRHRHAKRHVCRAEADAAHSSSEGVDAVDELMQRVQVMPWLGRRSATTSAHGNELHAHFPCSLHKRYVDLQARLSRFHKAPVQTWSCKLLLWNQKLNRFCTPTYPS